jgi:hypothetical protein
MCEGLLAHPVHITHFWSRLLENILKRAVHKFSNDQAVDTKQRSVRPLDYDVINPDQCSFPAALSLSHLERRCTSLYSRRVCLICLGFAYINVTQSVSLSITDQASVFIRLCDSGNFAIRLIIR